MTATTLSTPSAPAGESGVAPRSAASVIAVAIVSGASVFGLLIGAIAFGAMALAFNLAVPIAHQYGVVVSPNDAATAEALARVWWVFAIVAIGCVAAAAAIVIRVAGWFGDSRR